MALIGSIPRRCVNLPPGSLRALLGCAMSGTAQEGPALDAFTRKFSEWIGAPHVFGAASGRSAFQLALESLGLEKGKEIIFPAFTFPVMPMVAKLLGYKPVFCDVDPVTFNSGPEHIEPLINERTGAVLATHLFGQPCAIQKIAELAKKRNIRLLEDCAHALGVRVAGRSVGTFGDIGIYSFAEGKNMPCFGGGAIATSNEKIAQRARDVLAKAPMPASGTVLKKAAFIWLLWLLTRPEVFGVTVYPALRLKLLLGQPLMDSAVGDELLSLFAASNPRVYRLANLQAAIGLIQLERIDAFNEGARRNARILSESLNGIRGIGVPSSTTGDHIYVYYPLTVDPSRRNALRAYLLKHGFDTKTTDMSDCSRLEPFRAHGGTPHAQGGPKEASILEICVYPVISEKSIRRLGRVIRSWVAR
ncbi:MAG TPA: aminotransferase class I/II-fold pyridoxal phosphate-dependent enzyme [Nitrospirota bacterium]|nr:aminotransferase class I/II-fold pyridoxal phosphate-dependent enzyme [Nitrospirota bacterium]